MPGIEPGASRMRSERSTTELHPHGATALLSPLHTLHSAHDMPIGSQTRVACMGDTHGTNELLAPSHPPKTALLSVILPLSTPSPSYRPLNPLSSLNPRLTIPHQHPLIPHVPPHILPPHLHLPVQGRYAVAPPPQKLMSDTESEVVIV
ncbi:unnamed protein product [Rodentolepis nana]|uniref:Uncharacterized protein n=1 Tax=Rodentolepis nana TaxID=102285 RepID=A0A0R3TFZ8_RODNA|nr:unnamed protein product [Rodentolepis nana]